MTAAPERTITIATDAAGCRVTVTPPVPGFDFDLIDKPEAYARTYARSLARHHGWTLRDETMGGPNNG